MSTKIVWKSVKAKKVGKSFINKIQPGYRSIPGFFMPHSMAFTISELSISMLLL